MLIRYKPTVVAIKGIPARSAKGMAHPVFGFARLGESL